MPGRVDEIDEEIVAITLNSAWQVLEHLQKQGSMELAGKWQVRKNGQVAAAAAPLPAAASHLVCHLVIQRDASRLDGNASVLLILSRVCQPLVTSLQDRP